MCEKESIYSLPIIKEKLSSTEPSENLRKDLWEVQYSPSVLLLLDLVCSHYLSCLLLMAGLSVSCWSSSEVEVYTLIPWQFIAACWSLFMIAESAIKTKTKNMSQLANKVGGKGLELFLQINILIYMVGSCISYQIISKLKSD